jgi:hypothetical protein
VSLLILLSLAATARASVRSEADGLADALAARSILGPDTWSRVVRIENSAPIGFLHRGSYPRVVYATVFEVSGILWFYTNRDGTQSLSLTTGTVARDEASPGSLFRAIDPGFTQWTWVGESASPPRPRRPRNACFVESVARLLERMTAGSQTLSPELLLYYVDTPQGRLGHTVLVYGTSRGLAAEDPEVSAVPVAIPQEVGREPLALSTYLRGAPVAAARTLVLRCARPQPVLFAASPPSGGGDG